jgi:ADP-ribosylglycohydrolase
MLITRKNLSELLLRILPERVDQGADIDAATFSRRIESAARSYDALFELALELRAPPTRSDWPYVEPLEWTDLVAESEHLRPGQPWHQPDLSRAAERARTAFLGSVCGCMLGKPIEVDPTLAEIRAAAEATGEWPISDYISRSCVSALGRAHESAAQTVRESIVSVVADDDIHYTMIGMRVLEDAGPGFSNTDICRLWTANIPPAWCWGPERTALLTDGIAGHHIFTTADPGESRDVLFLNPGDESCGALIRVDAYGYACPGNPDLAAWLAWKDASFTHIKTGVYGAMFVAALIALCHSADASLRGGERLTLIEEALRRVPSNTRFAAVVRDALDGVAAAPDWLAGYAAVHGKYREYSHCRVYQEIGTLINTLRFARSVDHGFCLQVSQGNDTDSFGATAGSVLGALFGPDYLAERWLQPFGNLLHHALADFHEYKLDAVAERMARLPERVYAARAAARAVI